MTQKVIRIGSSAGVTIPKKQLDELGIAIGDEVKVTIKPVKVSDSDKAVIDTAKKILDKYNQDFQNLAQR